MTKPPKVGEIHRPSAQTGFESTEQVEANIQWYWMNPVDSYPGEKGFVGT